MKQFKFILLSLSLAIIAMACNQTTAQEGVESNYLSIEEAVSQDAMSSNSLAINFVEWTNFSTDENVVSEKAFGMLTVYGDMSLYTITLESDNYTTEGTMIFTVMSYEIIDTEDLYIYTGSAFGGDGYVYDWSMTRLDGRINHFRMSRQEQEGEPMTMVLYF